MARTDAKAPEERPTKPPRAERAEAKRAEKAGKAAAEAERAEAKKAEKAGKAAAEAERAEAKKADKSGKAAAEAERASARRRPEGQARRGGALFLRELAVLLVSALVIAVGVKTFVAQAFYIPSGSMLPQLEVGDRIVVSKLSYRLHEPRRGDVVVFDSPTPRPQQPDRSIVARVLRGLGEAVGVSAPSTDEFVKRVVALPGETVEARGGHIFVNGRELVEPYLPRSTVIADFGQVTVPEGRVFVMGDNRENSADSRVFGPIRKSSIVGRAFVRVWPFPSASFL